MRIVFVFCLRAYSNLVRCCLVLAKSPSFAHPSVHFVVFCSLRKPASEPLSGMYQISTVALVQVMSVVCGHLGSKGGLVQKIGVQTPKGMVCSLSNPLNHLGGEKTATMWGGYAMGATQCCACEQSILFGRLC